MALAPNQLKVLSVSSSNDLLFAFDSSAGVHCIFAIRRLVFDESEEQPEESNSASGISTTPAKFLPPDSFAANADSQAFHYTNTIDISRSAFDVVDRSRALAAVGPVESSPSLLRLALSNASFVGAHAVPSGDRFERCQFPSPLHADGASVASSLSQLTHTTTNSQAPSETPAGCVRSIPQNSTPSSASAIKSALKSSVSRTTSASQASHSRTESSKNVSFGEHLKYLCERSASVSATSRPAPLLEQLGSTPNEEAHLSKQFSEASCEHSLEPPMVIPVKSFLFQCVCDFCYILDSSFNC